MADPLSGRRSITHYLLTTKQCEDVIEFFKCYTNLQWLLPAKTEFGCRLASCFDRPVTKRSIEDKYGVTTKAPAGVDGYAGTMTGAVCYLPDGI